MLCCQIPLLWCSDSAASQLVTCTPCPHNTLSCVLHIQTVSKERWLANCAHFISVCPAATVLVSLTTTNILRSALHFAGEHSSLYRRVSNLRTVVLVSCSRLYTCRERPYVDV
eukprot:scpid107318/ scgid14034/ 